MFGNLEFVDFYGEDSAFAPHTLLYCEALVQRSEQHNWTIQPHRHRQITQLFVVLEGGVEVRLDTQQYKRSAPVIIVIPQGIMHGFDWQADSQGVVLSVATPMLQQVLGSLGLHSRVDQPFITAIPDTDRDYVTQLCNLLQQEANQPAIYQDAMLQALLQQLLIWLLRARTDNKEESNLSKSERKVRQFQQLIERHFTQYHQVSWYANEIRVSQAHLNQICREQSGENALALIHKVLLNEAKRYLVFADMPVAEIAERLGFSDPGYFNKFFKRKVGTSPATYRRQSQE